MMCTLYLLEPNQSRLLPDLGFAYAEQVRGYVLPLAALPQTPLKDAPRALASKS